MNLLFAVNCCNVIAINFCISDFFRVNFSPTRSSGYWYFSICLYWPYLPCHYCGMESTWSTKDTTDTMEKVGRQFKSNSFCQFTSGKELPIAHVVVLACNEWSTLLVVSWKSWNTCHLNCYMYRSTAVLFSSFPSMKCLC